MKGLTPGWDKDMHFVHSTDFFKSAHTKLAACGNQFELIGHKVSATEFSGEHSACALTQQLPACIFARQERVTCCTDLVQDASGMQVFLALPSDCPTDPDGSPQPPEGQAQADSVVLYASADEAQTFEQVI